MVPAGPNAPTNCAQRDVKWRWCEDAGDDEAGEDGDDGDAWRLKQCEVWTAAARRGH